ncbi:YjbF family lipoprotein [Paraglaciecola sp. L3A3]|uniref:YjbF family lipoprotein n=1 Tax=Paraglaciecola sp. L3A3 TaxID=2686358 RepID=UPI00131C41AC|nr:YjbF family lipoprotein [Paraglaciecola sp. L3A3]
MKLSTIPFIVFSLFALTSCSGTYRAYYQTLRIAFENTPDAIVSYKKVQDSEVDLASIRRGKRPKAILALAYLEDTQHKWVSADNAMFVIEKGRIVRTLGLNENLLFLSNTAEDPLKSLNNNKSWSRIADWTGDQYGYAIESTFSSGENEILTELSVSLDTVKYTEYVTYTTPSTYIQPNRSWSNTFWFERNSGTLIKSVQTLVPLSETIELVYLSRIARIHSNVTERNL